MIYILKAFAALMVLFVTHIITKGYKGFISKKGEICDGFLSLLAFIKTELSCRGRAVAEWASEFENAALGEIGFIGELTESGNLHKAFLRAKESAAMMSHDMIRVLESYFLSFGNSYRNEEEGEACRVFDELKRISEAEKTEAQKSMRAVKTISYAIALGIIVLFL